MESARRLLLQAFGFSKNLESLLESVFVNTDNTATLVFRVVECECKSNPAVFYEDCEVEKVVIPESKAEVYMTEGECLKHGYPYDKLSPLMDDSGSVLYPALVVVDTEFSVCAKPDSEQCGCPSCTLLHKESKKYSDVFLRDGFVYITVEIPSLLEGCLIPYGNGLNLLVTQSLYEFARDNGIPVKPLAVYTVL